MRSRGQHPAASGGAFIQGLKSEAGTWSGRIPFKTARWSPPVLISVSLPHWVKVRFWKPTPVPSLMWSSPILKSLILSNPDPRWREKMSLPLPPTRRLCLLPPSRKSFPSPSSSRSLPSLPNSLSLPLWPTSLSSLLLPISLSFLSVPSVSWFPEV